MVPQVQRLLMFGAGLAVGSSFVWVMRQAPPKQRISSRQVTSARWDIDRLFVDVSLSDIYTEQWMHETLSQPDSISLHQATSDGTIAYGEFHFSAEGTPLGVEDRLIVSKLLRSMTAYQVGLGLACAYQPGVLLRIQRDGHTIDYPICFGCRAADWYANGVAPSNSVAPRLGFSDASFPILREIVAEAFPSLQLSQTSTPRAEQSSMRRLRPARSAYVNTLPTHEGHDSVASDRANT